MANGSETGKKYWMPRDLWKSLRNIGGLTILLAAENYPRQSADRDERQRQIRARSGFEGLVLLLQVGVRAKHGLVPQLSKNERAALGMYEECLELEVVKAKLKAFDSWYRHVDYHPDAICNGSTKEDVLHFASDHFEEIQRWEQATDTALPDWFLAEVKTYVENKQNQQKKK